MPLEVIPAIDVSGGRLARLHAGSVVPVEAFGADPAGAAAERAVLGSGVLGEGWLPAALTGPLAERLVLGLEVEGDVVRPRGAAGGEVPPGEVLRRPARGAPR